MNTENKPIIQLLEENELKIGKLYKIYSQKIPDQEIFWSRLSREEERHAEEIFKLDDGSEMFIENDFTREAINYVTGFVDEEIKKAENGEILKSEAVNTALRVEQSIIEKKCLDFFIPSNSRAKEVMGKLNRETDKHIKMLQEINHV